MLSGHHLDPEATALFILHCLLKCKTIQKSTQIINTQHLVFTK